MSVFPFTWLSSLKIENLYYSLRYTNTVFSILLVYGKSWLIHINQVTMNKTITLYILLTKIYNR